VEEAAEKIIVYASYDTIMQANLVKTKLDAYAIPCFLSEENFNALYPFSTQPFSGVRLHIFENDIDRVKVVLEELHLFIEETFCPQCQSGKISIVNTQKPDNWRLSTVILYLISPNKKVYQCQDCHHEWD
jgi:hypothetical protein